MVHTYCILIFTPNLRPACHRPTQAQSENGNLSARLHFVFQRLRALVEPAPDAPAGGAVLAPDDCQASAAVILCKDSCCICRETGGCHISSRIGVNSPISQKKSRLRRIFFRAFGATANSKKLRLPNLIPNCYTYSNFYPICIRIR